MPRPIQSAMFVFALTSSTLASPPPADSVPPEALPSRSLGLIPNHGQYEDGVRFALTSPGVVGYLLDDGFCWYLTRGLSIEDQEKGTHRSTSARAGAWAGVRMVFEGCRPEVVHRPEEPLVPYANFFVGNDPSRWATRVPTFGRVVYDDLYPGVDVVVHRDSGAPQYDLVLEPHADLSAVRVRVLAADRIELVDDALLMHTEVGVLRQTPPKAFRQTDDGTLQPVEAKLRLLSDDTFEFVCPAVGGAERVIIDPQVQPFGPSYFTYLGGDDQPNVQDAMDHAADVAVLNAKATFTGTTSSHMGFPILNGVDGAHSGPGTTDIFVTRLSLDGTSLLWSTFVGGVAMEAGTTSDDEIGHAVAVRPGETWVAGTSSTTDFPFANDHPGAHGPLDSSHNGYPDAVVFRLTGGGSTLSYSTYLGGSFHDIATDIEIAPDRSVYVCGYTDSSSHSTVSIPFPTTLGVVEPTTFANSNTAFVCKIDRRIPGMMTIDQLVLSSFIRSALPASEFSPHDSWAWHLALDVDDDDPDLVRPCVVGLVQSHTAPGGGSPFPTTSNAFQTIPGNTPQPPALPDDRDGFVAVLREDFSGYVFASLVGGSGYDEAIGVDLYPDGRLVVTGATTSSSGFPTTSDAFQLAHAGNVDAFVLRVDTLAQSGPNALLFSSYLGGAGSDYGTGIAADSVGRVLYVTGHTDSLSVAGSNTNHGGYDVLLAKITVDPVNQAPFAAGMLFGGADDENAYGIELDTSSIYVTGRTVKPTTGNDFYSNLPATTVGFQTTHKDGQAYIAYYGGYGQAEYPSIEGPNGLDAFVLAVSEQ